MMMSTTTESSKTSGRSAALAPLQVVKNESGWGPTDNTLNDCVPQDFLDRPFVPFSKVNWSGRIADKFMAGKYKRYNSYHEDKEEEEEVDDSAFSTIDMGEKRKATSWRRIRLPTGGGGYRRNQNRGRDKNQGVQPNVSKKYNGHSRFDRRKKKWVSLRYNSARNYRRQYVTRQSSVKIEPDWEMVEQIDMKDLSKLSAATPKKIDNLSEHGSLYHIDRQYINVTTKAAKGLVKTKKTFYDVTTTEDEEIESMVMKAKGNVFATDTILSHLMTCTRSILPWDLVVRVLGTPDGKKIVFFDKRKNDGTFEYLTVDENAHDAPNDEDPDSQNSAKNLSLEATVVNKYFSQQILKTNGKRETFAKSHPFDQDGKAASVAYRYRRFDVGSDIKLVARTELHGVAVRNGKKHYVTCCALNEHDASSGWKVKLEKQMGAVFATAAKNNAFKVAKWTAQTVLSGASFMKLGYVTRTNFKDHSSHQILATQFLKPANVANLVALTQKNMWAVLQYLIKLCRKQECGTYALVRDPNKPVVRLYKMPDEEDEEEESDDEEAEE